MPEEPATAPDLAPIAAGGAQQVIAEAFAAIAASVQRAEALAMACARALDGPSNER
jgi:hypothetical protein